MFDNFFIFEYMDKSIFLKFKFEKIFRFFVLIFLSDRIIGFWS